MQCAGTATCAPVASRGGATCLEGARLEVQLKKTRGNPRPARSGARRRPRLRVRKPSGGIPVKGSSRRPGAGRRSLRPRRGPTGRRQHLRRRQAGRLRLRQCGLGELDRLFGPADRNPRRTLHGRQNHRRPVDETSRAHRADRGSPGAHRGLHPGLYRAFGSHPRRVRLVQPTAGGHRERRDRDRDGDRREHGARGGKGRGKREDSRRAVGPESGEARTRSRSRSARRLGRPGQAGRVRATASFGRRRHRRVHARRQCAGRANTPKPKTPRRPSSISTSRRSPFRRSASACWATQGFAALQQQLAPNQQAF